LKFLNFFVLFQKYLKTPFPILASGGEGKAGKAEDKEEDGGIGALADMLDNLDNFVVEPTPQGAVVKCRITRDRKGMDRGQSIHFCLYRFNEVHNRAFSVNKCRTRFR
jgi:hypothetical protein